LVFGRTRAGGSFLFQESLKRAAGTPQQAAEGWAFAGWAGLEEASQPAANLPYGAHVRPVNRSQPSWGLGNLLRTSRQTTPLGRSKGHFCGHFVPKTGQNRPKTCRFCADQWHINGLFDGRRGLLASQSGGDETGHLCRFLAHSPLESDPPANRLRMLSLPSVSAVNDRGDRGDHHCIYMGGAKHQPCLQGQVEHLKQRPVPVHCEMFS
jgi:hypothetical protein